jgi:hypothetical protein
LFAFVRLGTLILLIYGCAGAAEPVPQAYFESPQVREGRFVLWHDPGAVETLDFRYGIGGAEMQPRPPFQFVSEDETGTDPKVAVKDANAQQWVIKFGVEARPDTFGTRLAWALGYYVEPTYFIANGTIAGVHGLKRARREVDDSGRFQNGRFQLRSKEPKFLKWVTWSWDDNPFKGTPELGGLKIVMMLLSNWDNKDSRDADSRGTNTAIFQQGDLYYYFIDDWGGAMGGWGKFLTRSKWNADRFDKQSRKFVSMGRNGIEWGYTGQHTSLLTQDVGPREIAWLMQYLGRVTDEQLRAGLLSSGASGEEAAHYMNGLRERIRDLQQVSPTPPERAAAGQKR